MTFRPARAFAAGTTAVALAATLTVATAVPAHAAESTTAVNDSVTVDANHAITIDVLANDTAPAGTVVDGQIHFDARPNQKGETSIEYVVGNGGATGTATLTVDVDQHHQNNNGKLKQVIVAIVGWIFSWLF